MIDNIYKLFAKVLTERLKVVIAKSIDPQQMAFIKGRQIMDAMVIANEVVDSKLEPEKPGILCKLDMEKAYDHVNWKCLLDSMRRMDFGQKWIRWVKYCHLNCEIFSSYQWLTGRIFQCTKGFKTR